MWYELVDQLVGLRWCMFSPWLQMPHTRTTLLLSPLISHYLNPLIKVQWNTVFVAWFSKDSMFNGINFSKVSLPQKEDFSKNPALHEHMLLAHIVLGSMQIFSNRHGALKIPFGAKHKTSTYYTFSVLGLIVKISWNVISHRLAILEINDIHLIWKVFTIDNVYLDYVWWRLGCRINYTYTSSGKGIN